MFLLYYVWGFFFYLVFFSRNIIEYFYIKYNKMPIIFKRDFNDLSYFEKLFLVLFYRRGVFKNSIANIYSNNSMFNFRKSRYPLIFFFHMYFEKMDYKFSNLKYLNKFFIFFKNSKFFSNIFLKFKKFFFKKYKSNFFIFLVLQKLLYRRYYNLCSANYFINYNLNNLVKLNWLFHLFLVNSKNKLIIYDLSKYSDWYDFNFKNNNIKKILYNPTKLDKKKKIFNLNYKSAKFKRLTKLYRTYNLFFIKMYVKLNILYKNIFLINFKNFNTKKYFLNSSWREKLNKFYPIRFSESSVSKYIELNNVKNYLFFYIRKNRIFNKGRYSRNRQLYRTGVYWCLWLNIILVYGLYFLFYRFTFNFGYFWWGVLIFAYSTIFSRVVKYNFFNIYYIWHEFNFFIKWLGLLIINLKDYVNFLLQVLYKKVNKNNLFMSLISFFIKSLRTPQNTKFIYFWETMDHKDESFLRHKTITHWFNQFYKLMTY